MEIINKFIFDVFGKGFSEQARMLCILGGSVCLISCAFFYGRKLGLSKSKIFKVLLIAYPCLLGLMELTFQIASFAAINHFLGIDTSWQSGVRVFLFLPLVSWAISKILKIDFVLIADLLAIIRLVEYPLSTLGCVFTGCCRGFECDWGLYCPWSGTYYFPAQPLNALIMCVIAGYLFYRAKKRNYVPDGKQMSFTLTLVGSTRFLTEFLMDNEKLFWGVSVIGYYGIAMFIVGIIMLYIQKQGFRKGDLR